MGGQCVRGCRVASGPLSRDFKTDDQTDTRQYRKAEYPVGPILVLDLSGSLLGPRMSGRPWASVSSAARGGRLR